MISRSSALLGVGYGALSMALLGVTAIGSVSQPAIGHVRFVDAATERREAAQQQHNRAADVPSTDRSAMAQGVQRMVEVLPVFSGIEVTGTTERAVSVVSDLREVEVTDV